MTRARVRRLESDVVALGLGFQLLACMLVGREALAIWHARAMLAGSAVSGPALLGSALLVVIALGYGWLGKGLWALQRTACTVACVLALVFLGRTMLFQATSRVGLTPGLALVAIGYLFYAMLILSTARAAFTPAFHEARLALHEGPPRPWSSPVFWHMLAWAVASLLYLLLPLVGR